MLLISKFSKSFRFLLCFIDIYGKYAWVVPLKGRKGIRTTKVFQQVLNELSQKPNKTWPDIGRDFNSRSVMVAR